MTGAPPPLLEVQGLAASYGKVEALRDISLSIDTGAIVTVIGPNGAGKTTLLNAIMGLHPAKGIVKSDGHDLRKVDVEDRVGMGISLVPELRELFGELVVADNLTLGAYMVRKDRAEVRSRLEKVYDIFPRLAERRAQMADTLSGGERQMLALGRALMAKPRLLMLDEPSLGLAPLIVRDIFKVISSLRQTGVSILLVEQNARAALETADFGYVLENGEIKTSGSTAKLSNDPKLVATYLGGG